MRRMLSLAWLIAGWLVGTASARAEGTFYTTKTILNEFFRDSERVTYVEVRTGDARARLLEVLGYVPPKAKYVVFVAKTHDHIDGYAVLDEERGQHLPIGFATKLSVQGAVERTEIMAYREAYGEEIREVRFRKQFVGKVMPAAGERPSPALGDIIAISGATISSRAMGIAVKRAMALVDIVRHPAGPPPAPGG